MFDTPEGKAALREAIPYAEPFVDKLKVACVVEIEATDWPGIDALVEPKAKLMIEKLDWITKTLEAWAR